MDYLEKPEFTAMKPYLKICVCAFALATASAVHTKELGRLFFTPQQRALLDRGQQPATELPESTGSLTVNGIVQRHGGERTIWINGVPRLAGKGDERSPESTMITVPGQSKKIKAKVGQKVLINPDASKQ